MWSDVMNKSSIANIHTLSSVCAMLLFLPCSGVLSKLAMLTVPDSAEEAQELSMPVLDERLFKSPAVALQQAKSAVVKMSRYLQQSCQGGRLPWAAPLGHCISAQKCLSTPFHCDAKRTSGCFSGGPFLIQVQASISSSGTR